MTNNLDMEKILIAPSLLSADFMYLADEIERINATDADYIHLDIMDGTFVPNISFGWPVIKDLAKMTNKKLDLHLMVEHPETWIDKAVEIGADIMTVHYEACQKNIFAVCQAIKKAGLKVGVAINPGTNPIILNALLAEPNLVDVILVMTVNPGFGGQKCIEAMVNKVEVLALYKQIHGDAFTIEVDGGIDATTIKQFVHAGATMFVAGNFAFNYGDKNMQENINMLR